MPWSTLLTDTWRILSFRRPSIGIREFPLRYLIFGLLCAWLAGIGRYWDHPNAWLLQYLGLGSVIYVLALSSLLWLLLWPVCVQRLSWLTVCTFVALTSAPAWFYALPVERWMSAPDAASANLLFLLIVALWRVILLVRFLRHAARQSGIAIVVLTLLPLTLIVSALTVLNLEHATFNLMAGLHEELDPRGQAHFLVSLLAMGSILISPIVIAGYAALWYLTAQSRKIEARMRGPEPAART